MENSKQKNNLQEIVFFKAILNSYGVTMALLDHYAEEFAGKQGLSAEQLKARVEKDAETYISALKERIRVDGTSEEVK